VTMYMHLWQTEKIMWCLSWCLCLAVSRCLLITNPE
jgi:hypothetical protein